MNNKVIKITGEIKTSEEIIHIKNLMLALQNDKEYFTHLSEIYFEFSS